MKSMIAFIKRRPYLSAFYAASITGIIYAFIIYIVNLMQTGTVFQISAFYEIVLVGLIIGVFMFGPILLCVLNGVFIFIQAECSLNFEYISIGYGLICCVLYEKMNVRFAIFDWMQGHAVLVVLAAAGVLGYLIVRFLPKGKLTRMLQILGMGLMALGVVTCICICVLLREVPFLVLYGVNLIIVTVKVFVASARERRQTLCADFKGEKE